MRFDLVLEPVYLVGSLWGVVPGAPVCASASLPRSSVVREIAGSSARSVPAAVTAFVGVNVVPLDTERVLTDYTVLVEDGRITALGPVAKVKVPAGAVRIDGRGKYLMPGLSDMHEHNASENPTMDRLFHFVANGVTTVRYIDFSSLTTKQRLAKIPGPHPRVYIEIGQQDFLQGSRPSLDSIPARVAAQKARGYDFLKLDAVPPKNSYEDSMLVAVGRAGFPIAIHSHGQPFDAVVMLGAYGASNDHLSGFQNGLAAYFTGAQANVDVPAAEIEALAVAAQRSGVWNSPTLNCMESKGNPNSKSMQVSRQIIKALQDKGAGLLIGADADFEVRRSPSMVHNELASLVGAGLSPYQALVAGSRNVAQYLRLLDSAGTVAVGKRADLVLLYGNPLADIRHTREPAGVMVAGQWLDRAALDQRLMTPATGPRPRPWPVWDIERSTNPTLKKDQYSVVMAHIEKFGALTDSLGLATASAQSIESESRRFRQLLAAELGGIRAVLTPVQHRTFDPPVRVWLREQARQGHTVTVSGVTPVP